jgi:hypothetical protein
MADRSVPLKWHRILLIITVMWRFEITSTSFPKFIAISFSSKSEVLNRRMVPITEEFYVSI